MPLNPTDEPPAALNGPVAAVVLTALGNPGRLQEALGVLRPVCQEHGLRLVLVWPGEVPPPGLESRSERFEVVLVAADATSATARKAGAARALADLMMFTDDELAIAAGWADVVALRLGLIRRGSHALGDNWASILSEQGVPDSAHGS